MNTGFSIHSLTFYKINFIAQLFFNLGNFSETIFLQKSKKNKTIFIGHIVQKLCKKCSKFELFTVMALV